MTLPRIMVVGERAALRDLVDYLEAAGRYRIYFVSARALARLTPWPDVVLLHIPEDKEAAAQALPWLDTLKDQVPVVALSRAADTECYLAAITRGAFAYLTSYTSPAEVARVLRAAIRWRQHHPAA